MILKRYISKSNIFVRGVLPAPALAPFKKARIPAPVNCFYKFLLWFLLRLPLKKQRIPAPGSGSLTMVVKTTVQSVSWHDRYSICYLRACIKVLIVSLLRRFQSLNLMPIIHHIFNYKTLYFYLNFSYFKIFYNWLLFYILDFSHFYCEEGPFWYFRLKIELQFFFVYQKALIRTFHTSFLTTK